MSFRATCLTLFPEAFPGLLSLSIVGAALQNGLWELETVDIRSFGLGKHRTVDDTPAGGGAGMVMRALMSRRRPSTASSRRAALASTSRLAAPP
jgi:tRNA (guanine37-N1)-methyltransferase